MRTSRMVAVGAAVLVGGGALIAATGGVSQDRPAVLQGTDTFGANTGASDLAGAASRDDSADEAAAGGGGAATRVPAAAPRVVKTARLHLSVTSDDAVTRATARVNRIAEAHGGFVAGTESQRDEHRQATFTLRVPVANYDAALAELRRLGKVTNESLGGRDVTSALVDLDARLRTLRAQEEALNALVTKARTVGETLEVAREAAGVRMQIEQLAAQQAQLADQADFATITLDLVGPAGARSESTAQPRLVDALERAVAGTLAVLSGVIILLGYVVPSAVLAGVAYALWRLLRSRRLRSAPVAS